MKERQPVIHIVHGDITRLEVDAIVNAANRSLLGGGGVDGAIHQAAGPDLLAECKKLGGCETGQAQITRGYRLPAKYVIHAVGPVWNGGFSHESYLLSSCYRVSLNIAISYGLHSIAFPCISTGIYRFPGGYAAKIAWHAVHQIADEHPDTMPEVTFCCFLNEDYEYYSALQAGLNIPDF